MGSQFVLIVTVRLAVCHLLFNSETEERPVWR